jgi:acetyltransferase
VDSEVMKNNRRMLKLAESLSFRVEPHPEDDSVRYVSRNL